ncbi:MAG: bifunctional aspartate kinase/homoserine dehydrogenase I [Bacteroidota bacterium]
MLVIKFGGTSVATAKNISLVKDIISEKDKPVIVVVSALGGITNLLIECSEFAAKGDDTYIKIFNKIEERHLQMIKDLISVKAQGKTLSKVKILLNELEDIYRGVFLIHELSLKTLDRIVSFGEIASSMIINDFLLDQGLTSQLAAPKELIQTDSNYGRANVNFNTTNRAISSYFKNTNGIWICPGFIATNARGETTTLGRGGSDYSAAIIAAALKTKQLEIWTDVSGMMTADPRMVRSAYAIEKISYEEAMELSHFGAKVLYPPSIQPVLDAKIPICIKNTFDKDHPGTVISKQSRKSNGKIIKGLSSIRSIALFSLTGSGMVGIPNFSYRLFKALSQAQINVILITQASSEHSICVGIDQADSAVSKKAIETEFEYELAIHKVDKLDIETDLAIVALVGSNMQQQVGVSGKMFSVLGQNGVNIKAIAQGSSEKNISVVINGNEVKKALNSLHESFFLSERKQLNLFMIGVGNVGGTLIEQLKRQKDYLAEHLHINIRIAGLANSKKMLFKSEGIELNQWKDELLKEGKKMKLEAFINEMYALNMRNSIFIDNTAEESVASSYQKVLEKSISVVTPNKIACTQSYSSYQLLKHTALRYRTQFLFETNVGAGLPVINTLSDLIKSGDEVVKIQAVLSGSLNFIFNNFSEKTRFIDIVKQAQEEGYTEPDPRIDLSGVDVMRKILILIRESGFEMELKQIKARPFMPNACMNTKSVSNFFKKLETHEKDFQDLFIEAEDQGAKMKYVASFDKGKAEAGIEMITPDHPFYNLEGKDNIVLFYTKRYTEQPLVIKGAGAGAEVTAMGIFGDIMRIAHE